MSVVDVVLTTGFRCVCVCWVFCRSRATCQRARPEAVRFAPYFRFRTQSLPTDALDVNAIAVSTHNNTGTRFEPGNGMLFTSAFSTLYLKTNFRHKPVIVFSAFRQSRSMPDSPSEFVGKTPFAPSSIYLIRGFPDIEYFRIRKGKWQSQGAK